MHNINCEIDLLNKEILYKNLNINECKNNSIKIISIGALIGGYYKDKIYEPKDYLNLLLKYSNSMQVFNELMRALIGPCYIIIIKKNTYRIYASNSSSGFLYLIKNNKLFINNIEGDFYYSANNLYNFQEINEEAIYNALLSHHSLMRSPFTGLLNNTFRCPPGFFLEIDKSKNKLNSFILLNEKDLENNKDRTTDLHKSFKAISTLYNLYCEKNNIKMNILMSGGIDSSLLLSYFIQDFKDIKLLYHNYNKKLENKLAHQISDVFNLDLVEVEKSQVKIKDLENYANKGMGMFIHPSHFDFIKKNNQNTDFKLRGQNGDTLFHVDHFGPNNRVGGLARVLMSIKSIKFRIYHYISFFKKRPYLRLWPFSVKLKNFNFEFKELVYNSLFSIKEHSVPFMKTTTNDKLIINYRNDYYWKPIEKIFNENYKDRWKNNYNPHLTNHLNRIVRWLRTITNFSQQFSNRSDYENSISITPYCEGPISTILLKWELNNKDFFVIKRFSLKYFNYNSKNKYSKIRIRTIGYYNLFKQILSIFIITNKKKMNIDFKDFEKINQYYKYFQNDNFKINKNFQNKIISERINKIYNSISNYEECIDNKNDTSELCNLLNLHILFKNIFHKS